MKPLKQTEPYELKFEGHESRLYTTHCSILRVGDSLFLASVQSIWAVLAGRRSQLPLPLALVGERRPTSISALPILVMTSTVF
jgi:hypothetical protein